MSAFGQYIPSENEDILHRRFNIYCNCLRRYTASANEVYLHFQRSRIGKLWTFILRSCFEFLQKVFLGLMYPFSCVLWAIFWSFRQIARYLPHHRSENASKTHPKSSHDKFKTASYFSHTAMDLIQVPGSSIIVRIVSVSFRQLLALTQL